MTRTVGRVDFLVDFDGKKLPAKAKQVGRNAGQAMGKEMSAALEPEMAKIATAAERRLRESGDIGGIKFADALQRRLISRRSSIVDTLADIFSDRGAFRDFINESGDVDSALEKLNATLDETRESGNLTWNEFQSLSKATREWGGELQDADRAAKRHRAALFDLQQELDRSTTNYDRVSSAIDLHTKKLVEDGNEEDKRAAKSSRNMPKLSHNARQWTLIIAAIAAGGSQIATLGSAAGVGITNLAGAIAATLPALVVAGAAFAGIAGEMVDAGDGSGRLVRSFEKVAPSARGAARALVEVGGQFKRLQQAIQGNFFAEMEASIFRLRDSTLPSLFPAIESLATKSGAAFGRLLDKLGDEESITQFNELLQLSGTVIEDVVDIVDGLISSLGNIFVAGEQSILGFTQGLSDLIGEFEDWTSSIEGQQTLREWFSNGSEVLGGFIKLLGRAGKVLSGLVDEEQVERTLSFLESLGDLIESLEPLLRALGEIDVFTVLADSLSALLDGVEPILDFLAPQMEAAGLAITRAFELLSPILSIVSSLLLGPLTLGLKTAMAWQEKLQPHWDAFSSALQLIAEELVILTDEIWAGLEPALGDLMDTLIEMLPTPEELVRLIRDDVIPAIRDWADIILNDIIPAITDMLEWMQDLYESVGGWEGLKSKFTAFGNYFKTLATVIRVALGPVGALISLMAKELNRLFASANAPVGGGGAGFVRPTARGGVFSGAQMRTIAEEGDEAVVPLDRPLSEVDPAVRALSAIAQGLTMGGGTTSSSRGGITVAEGAIVVSGVRDPFLAAKAMLDELVLQAQ